MVTVSMASRVSHEGLTSTSRTKFVLERSRPLPLQSQSSRNYGASLRDHFSHWWFELLCMLLMLLSFLAIVLTLAIHQGQPLPQWPLSISINAALSIFGAVLKGTMLLVVAEGLSQVKWAWFRSDIRPLNDIDLFDSATRGPKGALDLLWASRLRLGASLFPVIGALLTVVAIGIDPFTQQILAYYSCTTVDPNGRQATIARANNYISLLTNPETNIDPTYHRTRANLESQGSYFAGLFGNPSGSAQPDPPFNCPTGDCDFHDDYYAVGVCSACEDITSTINVSEETESNGDPYLIHTLPHSNLSLQTRKRYDGITYLAAESMVKNGTISWLSIDMELIRHVPPQAPLSIEVPDWSNHSKELGAARCGLYPCVHKYHASIRGSKLDEELLDSTPLKLDFSDSVPTARVACLSDQERSDLSSMGYDMRASPDWLYLDRHSAVAIAAINETCLFNYDIFQWGMTGITFGRNNEMTNGTISIHNATTGFYGGSIQGTSKWAPMGPLQLMALFNGGNITFASVQERFGSIAASMSSHIRRANFAENGTQPAIGTVRSNATCIAVRWPWLLLPLSLLLLTLVFFFTTMYSSKSQHPWKSSSLALLFHGLDHPARAKCGVAATLDDMKVAAKMLHVRLQETDEGWKFSESAGCNGYSAVDTGYKAAR